MPDLKTFSPCLCNPAIKHNNWFWMLSDRIHKRRLLYTWRIWKKEDSFICAAVVMETAASPHLLSFSSTSNKAQLHLRLLSLPLHQDPSFATSLDTREGSFPVWNYFFDLANVSPSGLRSATVVNARRHRWVFLFLLSSLQAKVKQAGKRMSKYRDAGRTGGQRNKQKTRNPHRDEKKKSILSIFHINI